MTFELDTIIFDDVLKGLATIPDGIVSLVVTSPPYNVGMEYGKRDDREPWKQYIDWLGKIMKECKRVLRDGGRLIINIDSIVNHEEDNDKEYFRPIYADLVNIGRDVGLNFRTDICWFKHQVVGRATAWGSYCLCSNPTIRRNHEYLLVWSKGPWRLEGDSEQSDMTKAEFEEWTMSFWHIQPETKKKGGHPCPFPEELVKRCIKLFSYRGDVVLDPFMGSGTTAYVAKMLSRHYIGIENSKEWLDYANDRVASISDMFGDETYIPRSERLKKEPPTGGEQEPGCGI